MESKNYFRKLSRELLVKPLYYERGMEYSFVLLLNFFAPLSARLDFKHKKINKTNKNAPFHARCRNKP